MAALEFLSQPLWQRLTFVLLHFIWQGTLLALVLAIGLAWARQAHVRYMLALMALAGLALCPLATAVWLETPSVEVAAVEAGYIPTATTSELAWLPAVQPYLLLIWLSGVCILSIRLLTSYLAVRKLRARTLPLDAMSLGTARRLMQILSVSRHVQVKASKYVREALVVGLWRPMVIMPAAWLTELQPQVIEAVLAHELAHIRRHDLWINLVQRVLETLFFYHPAVWYVSRILRVEREKCCDELAVAATGQKVIYVEALELVARRRLAESPSVWAAAMGGTRTMNLLDRVRNVLGQGPSASSARYWPVGVAALVAPVVLWCASLALAPAAQAQEDKPSGDRPAEREGDRPDRPRAEGERRDGDRRPEGPRDGERRPDGPPRDGERRPDGPPRDGERRPDGPPRDGERRPEAGPREGGRRPDGPPREGDRPRDGERPGPRGEGPPVPPELLRLIAELREEVGMLRREVRELRANRGPAAGPPPRREGEPRRDGAPGREGPPRRDGEPRSEGDRPREGGPRPDGDRPREGRPGPGGERRPDGPPPREGDRPREGERPQAER